ncbi:MAG: hypothetical protein JEY97_06390 [Bacteroidales bacterium]|nr:hypothetical protein [Bacteroidales bacterium]
MTLDNDEIPINKVLMADNDGRKVIQVGDSRWGELIIPANTENPDKNSNGFRVLAINSFLLGYVLFETLKECEKRFPDKLNIVGLVTDDPANPNSKISLKRRIWRIYNEKERVVLESEMIEAALSFGVPCYTGEVKSDYFRKLLNYWKPDAILVCVFGQIVDAQIINYPKYGIYNFHPADLANHYGAGPRPYEDLINRNASTSKVTIHQITEDVDSGHIVCQSPPVNVRLENGKISDKILVLDDKMMKPIDKMGAALISALIRKKESGKTGKIDKLDVDNYFSDDYKKELMKPIISNIYIDTLPKIDKDLNFFNLNNY